MKKIVFHWVWIGPTIPTEKFSGLKNSIKQLSKTNYTGALWWFKIGEKDFDLNAQCCTYRSINGQEIDGCMGELNLGDGATLPVFEVSSSRRIEIWAKRHKIPNPSDYIISRILLSNVIRLKVLAWYQGLYLDFDAELKSEVLVPFLKDIEEGRVLPITCHYKREFPENDFIWVPPFENTDNPIAHLYMDITEGKTTSGQKPLGKLGGAGMKSLLTDRRGKTATYVDLEYNIKEFRQTCDFKRFARELAQQRPTERYILPLNDGGYKVFWTELVRDFPRCFNKDAVARMISVGDSAQDISANTGFNDYQDFMNSNKANKSSKMISALFTKESLIKSFYSWKDPGSQDIVDIFKKEGLLE